MHEFKLGLSFEAEEEFRKHLDNAGDKLMEGPSDEIARQTLYKGPFEEFQRRLRAGTEQWNSQAQDGGAPSIRSSGSRKQEAAEAAGQNRGRKRKLSGESAVEEGATSEQTAINLCVAATAINIKTAETEGAIALSSNGDDCQGAGEETFESGEEETTLDREMLEDCPQQVESVHDPGPANQEREIDAGDKGPDGSDSTSSDGGDDCEGADDESSELDDEETPFDKEMLDDRSQPIDSAHDHRLADQEREMGASTM
ncbi:hypothetical protein KFL_003110010, partial [Klebsormidium nitens]